jgi:hypothetical protein
MKFSRKLFVTTALLLSLQLPAVANPPRPQALTSLTAVARGQGTLTAGKEVFKVSTVVVNLKEDGTGELTLVTDLQFFVQCTWSAPADVSKGVDLKITGGANAGGLQGSGKILLRPDGKAIASLSLDAISSTSKRKFHLDFVAAE